MLILASSSHSQFVLTKTVTENWVIEFCWNGMANPLLESFGEPPKACMTNSSCPPANFKGKENPDLPSICSNYWPSNVPQFVFEPFSTFKLLAMQVYNFPEICQAHSQHPPHSTVPLEKPLVKRDCS